MQNEGLINDNVTAIKSAVQKRVFNLISEKELKRFNRRKATRRCQAIKERKNKVHNESGEGQKGSKKKN